METAESLRRSKRNKFHLDIAAIHGHPSKKSRLDPLSINIDGSEMSMANGVDGEEDGRRKRRSAPGRGFLYDDNDDDEELGRVGLEGRIPVQKVSSEALRIHQRIHQRFGVVTATPSPNIPNVTATTSTAPQPAPISQINKSTYTRAENGDASDRRSTSATPPRLSPALPKQSLAVAEAAPSSSSPPPLLPNPSQPPVLQEGGHMTKCPVCPFTSESPATVRQHTAGHKRTSGFQCPACSFKSMSPMVLKKHAELHEVEADEFALVYVGEKADLTRKKIKFNQLRRAQMSISSARKTESGFECDVTGCDFNTTCRTLVATHKLRAHRPKKFAKNSKFFCRQCSAKFATQWELRRHKERLHKRFRNPNARLFFLTELIGHDFLMKFFDQSSPNKEVVASPEPESPSPSLEAEESPSCSSTVTDRTEDSTQVLTYQCDMCPYKAPNQSRMKRHTQKHLVSSDIKCKSCTFSCRGADVMAKHEQLHSINENAEKAAESPKVNGTLVEESRKKVTEILHSQPSSTSLREALKKWLTSGKRHSPNSQASTSAISIRVVGDDGVKKRRCALCPYETKFLGDMRTHRAMHSMNAKYRCTQCSYTTKRNVSLRQHLSLHTKMNLKSENMRPHKIIISGKHVGMKRGSGPLRNYSCKQCPYVTSSLATFWRHARRHDSPAKQNVCSMCNYSSAFVDKMEEHQLLHPEGSSYIKKLSTNEFTSCGSMPQLTQALPLPSFSVSFASTSSSEPCSPMKPVSSVSPLHVRPPSERSTKGKKNEQYQAVVQSVKMVDAKPEVNFATPLSVDVVAAMRVMRQRIGPSENIAVHDFLKLEKKAEEELQCPDCPYSDENVTMFRLHRDMHAGPRRSFACNICSYSSCTAEALHFHLNLHIPPLSPASAANQKKKQLIRKRYPNSEPIPLGSKYFTCTQCTYRTAVEVNYVHHRLEHAMNMQQRLITQIKRATTQDDDSRRKERFRRIAKKGDKDHMCNKCCFRCELSETFSRHVDMHGQNSIHQCRICDYSSMTKSVVEFHESNHHLDLTMGLIEKKAALCPDLVKLEVPTPTVAERVNMTGQELRCGECNYSTFHAPELGEHFAQNHANTEEMKREAEFLRMGLFPRNTISTTS
ncbi:unnamed protein product [Caenorhabditis auriculariae]|uniref:C2H2-type domain-containing protein n=1 Tax=Caenorhabditis auriculariae TaxID=2777116 RepID=A0A8S1H3T0_9PELO|nr:unnamed protein product [Caenorhabditis auriculariae]